MAQLPTDRTKLNAAIANQQPSIIASAQANREAMIEGYDSIDLLYQNLLNYQASIRYLADGGNFTDTSFVNVIDGGTFV